MTREEAIAVLRREIEPSVYEDEKSIAEAIDMAIEALQADRPHGEWIFEETDEYKRTYCSVCDVSAPFVCVSNDYYGRRFHGETRKTKFCPNCGARMEAANEL